MLALTLTSLFVAAPAASPAFGAPAPKLSASLDPKTLDCGIVPVLSAASCGAVTLTNTGSSTLFYLLDISATGPHALDWGAALDTCSVILSPGQSCAFSVSFAPQSIGRQSATLNVTATPWFDQCPCPTIPTVVAKLKVVGVGRSPM